jgi:hypothetical protein
MMGRHTGAALGPLLVPKGAESPGEESAPNPPYRASTAASRYNHSGIASPAVHSICIGRSPFHDLIAAEPE